MQGFWFRFQSLGLRMKNQMENQMENETNEIQPGVPRWFISGFGLRTLVRGRRIRFKTKVLGLGLISAPGTGSRLHGSGE